MSDTRQIIMKINLIFKKIEDLKKQGKCTRCGVQVDENATPSYNADELDTPPHLFCKKCFNEFTEEKKKAGGGVVEIGKKK